MGKGPVVTLHWRPLAKDLFRPEWFLLSCQTWAADCCSLAKGLTDKQQRVTTNLLFFEQSGNRPKTPYANGLGVKHSTKITSMSQPSSRRPALRGRSSGAGGW